MEVITSRAPLPPVAEAKPVSPAGQPQKEQQQSLPGQGKTAEAGTSLSTRQAEELVAMIQAHISSMNINVSFSTYGDEKERTAIVVTEKESGKVIREIPPEELQKLHMKMEELLGMIFNDRA